MPRMTQGDYILVTQHVSRQEAMVDLIYTSISRIMLARNAKKNPESPCQNDDEDHA